MGDKFIDKIRAFVRPAKGYRTLLVSAIPIVLGVLNLIDWNSFFNDWKSGVTGILSGLLMALMRYWTTTPVGQADPAMPPVVVEVLKDAVPSLPSAKIVELKKAIPSTKL